MDFIRDSVYPEITLKSQNYSIRPVMSMTYIKSIKSNHKRRTDRKEVHSRPTGVNPQGQSRRDLNRQLIKTHQRTGSFGKVQEELIRLHCENNFQPQCFLTLLRTVLPHNIAQCFHARLPHNASTERFHVRLTQLHFPASFP